MSRLLIAALAVVLFAVPAAADPRVSQTNPLSRVSSYQCTFTRYGVARWTGSEPAVVAGEENFTFGIGNIDLRRGRARIVGTSASAEATAMLTPLGLNVIEQTPGGNFILTTVFTVTQSADRYYAVHSRHLGDVTTPPSASQYYGTCEVVE